jgi:hypothetical protein
MCRVRLFSFNKTFEYNIAGVNHLKIDICGLHVGDIELYSVMGFSWWQRATPNFGRSVLARMALRSRQQYSFILP